MSNREKRMSNVGPPVRIGNVLHPVADVAAAVRFYEDAFGISTKFIDGDRYAALDAPTSTKAAVDKVG